MSKKSGPPAHANKEKWVPARADKHNTLKKLVAALPNEGVCKRCKEQIEWKKDYGKYKPLKVPGKCTGCGQRAVEHAYHTLCQACAQSRAVCAKCGAQAPLPEVSGPTDAIEMPSATELALMSERQRRSAIRKVEKAQRERKEAERAERAALTAEPATVSLAKDDARGGERPSEPLATACGHVDLSHASNAVAVRLDADEPACWSDRDQDGRSDQGEDAAADALARAQCLAEERKEHVRAQRLAMMGDDDAAVEAVQAEGVSEDDDEEGEGEDEGEEEEDGEAGGAGEGTRRSLSDGEESADDDDEEEDDTLECVTESLEALAFSAGAAALVLQGYPGLRAADYATAEAGVDALIERLEASGGRAAAEADAISDRVATVLQQSTAGGDETVHLIGTLVMLLELQKHALSAGAQGQTGAEADALQVLRRARHLSDL